MQLTPLDIKKQEFKKSIRGFDTIEVEAFLEMIAEEYENVIREKNNLADEVIKLRTQLKDYQEVEKTLQETLMTAQQSLNDSKENSKREAETIIREAELKSEFILQDTKLKLAELKNDLVVVKAQKDSFGRRLKHLLESQLDLLQVLELDDLGFAEYEEKRIIRKPPNVSLENHHRKSPPPVSLKEEETIEFEGIDDVVPEEGIEEIKSLEKLQPAEPENLNWLEQQNSTDKNTEEIKEKKSRISDQLIF